MMNIPIYESNIVLDYYNHENNLEIEYCNPTSKEVLVCFSDNGLFWPYTEEQFIENIQRNNCYQWKNLLRGKGIKDRFRYIVYVRDIWQSWYVYGINKRCDRIWKIAEYIVNIIQKMEIIRGGI